ncbi:hypothetical protein [Segetibacter koreensis]|uniref:hypothetical protein n=1 Tax=Segetibacter koreensis TaxID=398037 RepID=UPI0003800CD6|nr:hypothetical protein [Segetibacter koreensis]
MKTIVIILFAVTIAKVKAQDNKRIYWKFADSMWMKQLQGDTTAKNRYIDSMAKYSRLDAVAGKRLK